MKIKVIKLSSGHRVISGEHKPVSDYLYTVYFLSIPIHSVTFYDLTDKAAKQLFKNRI